MGKDPESLREHTDDVRARAAAVGRDPRALAILAGISLVVGQTEAEARAKYDALKRQLHPEVARFRIAQDLEVDLSGLDWGKPIPLERIPTEAKYFSAFKAQLLAEVEEGRTLGEIALGYERGQGVWTGSPSQIADRMLEWREIGGVDGFMVTFQSMPDGLDGLVNLVVPELQRRGVFRTEYHSTTLRGHLDE